MTGRINSEDLYNITQLARLIFIQRSVQFNFTLMTDKEISRAIDKCFDAAQLFIKNQNRRADEIDFPEE